MIKYFAILGLSGFIGANVYMYTQNLLHYKSVIKKEKTENVKAIVFYKDSFVKIYRKPIGITKDGRAIDTSATLFSASFLDECEKNLVIVEGDYSLWPKYHDLLCKNSLIGQVYHVVIKKYKLEIWLLPGVLVELWPDDSNCIKNLAEFYASYPDFFKNKGKRIDLRNTKRVGVSDI